MNYSKYLQDNIEVLGGDILKNVGDADVICNSINFAVSEKFNATSFIESNNFTITKSGEISGTDESYISFTKKSDGKIVSGNIMLKNALPTVIGMRVWIDWNRVINH